MKDKQAEACTLNEKEELVAGEEIRAPADRTEAGNTAGCHDAGNITDFGDDFPLI
jgi:hypothetical protein